MERKQTHMMYGGITALVLVIIGLLLYILDLSFQSWAQWVTYAVFLVGIILNAMVFSKANDGYVTFGSVFSSSFKSAAIITLVMIVWSFVIMMIFPEIKERGIEEAIKGMEKQGMSDEQIDQGLEMTKKYFNVFMVGGVLFSYMFFGAVFSLISAAIAKKKGDMPPSASV